LSPSSSDLIRSALVNLSLDPLQIKLLKRPIHGGNLTWAANLVNCPVSAIIDFSASINPLGPPQSAIASIQEALPLLTSYPDPHYVQLCSCLASHHQLTADWILPGNGAAELLTWVAWEFSCLDKIYVPSPGFADYQRALQTFNLNIEPYKLNLLESGSISSSRSSGLVINNPHNPTGKLWTLETIIPYLDKFTLVMIDEAFMDFLPPSQQQSLISLIPHFDNLIILRSLTKFYSLPGLRLGYIVSNPQRIQRWQKWRDPWTVNILAAKAGEAVIQDHQFQQQTYNWLIPTREELFQGIASLADFQPLESAANFLLVETKLPSSQLQLDLLQNHHILIRDCLSFAELGDRFFRIAVRTKPENQLLLNALLKINHC
jgi:L-threonine-O-3-phosphate decarboxylase